MSATPLSIMSGMFFDPSTAFDRLRARTSSWLPLIAVTLGTALVYWWYYQTVDFGWLVDHTLAANPDFTDEQRESTRSMMTPAFITNSSLAATLIVTPISFAVFAIYYSIVGKITDTGLRYRDWFAFCVWTSVPRLLLLPLMAFQILTSDGRVAPEDLSMVSINTLFLQLPNSHPWAGFAAGLDLSVLWSCVLAVLGLRVWTGRSTGACIALCLLPLAIVYGGWAAKILVFG
ncbi:YIP1 family protein [Massilia sp. ST3]|uniref:YIP1 family protein n=1 Tax=Massilia sp. ST3 TaxID=2824903 RepID=UPI001B842C63|nr:YIP1 family protein [Massilia sp. ST3]MBQ5949406.1 YIP1 family protein [Massilia sp. ST3]